jgi:hypothetical protein
LRRIGPRSLLAARSSAYAASCIFAATSLLLPDGVKPGDGFDHAEAQRAFQAAQKLDPQCAAYERDLADPIT